MRASSDLALSCISRVRASDRALRKCDQPALSKAPADPTLERTFLLERNRGMTLAMRDAGQAVLQGIGVFDSRVELLQL